MYESSNPPVAFLMSAMWGQPHRLRAAHRLIQHLEQAGKPCIYAQLCGASCLQLSGPISQLLRHHGRIVRGVTQLAQVKTLRFGAGQRRAKQRLRQLRRA